MPTTVVIPSLAPVPLPVSLELAKEHLRVDGTIEDKVITQKLKAALSLCEQYCGRVFRAVDVKTTFTLDEPYVLDPLAGKVSKVEGFLTDISQLPTADASFYGSTYLEEYRKGISVNRQLPWGAALNQTYTVYYTVQATEDTLPAAVVEAVLKLTSDLYENRETSVIGSIQQELSVSYRVLLAPYRLANVLN